MKNLLVIIISMLTLCGCANVSFDVKSVTLDGEYERFGEHENDFFPCLRNGYYLDDDGTIVALWREDYTAYPEIQMRQYLLRISPNGSYTKTLIYDSGLTDLHETLLTVNSFGIFKNPRKNTVLVYSLTGTDIKAGEKELNVTYIFEEFDYNFNQVKRLEYSEAYAIDANQSWVAMDDNGYFYSGSRLNALVFNPDFEYLGEINGLPEVIEYDNPYYVEYFIPITGADGAVYIRKVADDEPQTFYKIDPLTQTAKKVFTLSADKTHTIWRGDMRDGALFYTSGETAWNENKRGLMKIGKTGIANMLMYWGETVNNVSTREIVHSEVSDNGNFYRLTIEDSDGNNETEGDDVIKLISFIRN
jgi:hypothetical protein